MQLHRTIIFGGALTFSALLGVGGGVAGASSAKGVATLHTISAAVGGRTETILVDAQGLPLYYFENDTAKKSLVTGGLARLWPPLVANRPTASGVHGKVTALKAANGHQVEYNGHFLYTFVNDSPGNVSGQGVSNFYVATPRLKTIGTSATVAAPPPAPASSRYGY
jgi:predicted lipoprotein with Yx(FWY)xxD motif